jgi:2,5-diketo-D-gluconate reductase A
MPEVPTVTLNNGVEIPQLGFGVYQVEPDDTFDTVLAALEVGYRHIDTAQMYRNERQVGEAVRASGLDWGDVFVTSKLNNGLHARHDALRAFDGTLEALGSDHVDLFLIHWPTPDVGDYVETWRALEEIYRSGRARAIGVSNFQPAHLHRVMAETETVPACNQVEVHPYLRQDEVRMFGAAHGIATEAWAPLAQGAVLDDPVIVGIADQVGRTPAQVTLRWHIQRGDIVFPKTVTPRRMEENFDLFGFQLTDDHMAAIDGLNRDERQGPDPDQFNWSPH